MSEVNVTKEKSPAKRETAPAEFKEFFKPVLPFRSFFHQSPFALMRDFSAEMDRILRGVAPATDGGAWSPAIDIQQCNGNLVVTAELPGLKKEEVKGRAHRGRPHHRRRTKTRAPRGSRRIPSLGEKLRPILSVDPVA